MNNEHNNTELNIEIERLVLEGISLTFYQQQQLKEAVEIELGKIFLTNGIPKIIEPIPERITGNEIQLEARHPKPDSLGKQIATSIYNGLKICGNFNND